MKKYRVEIDMIEHGYVDVEAESVQEATNKATEISNEGGFVGINSEARIVAVRNN
jgi:hypothetical protein